jgi:hypothetical protein
VLHLQGENKAAYDMIKARTNDLDNLTDDAPLLHVLLVLQELRTATGILRAGLIQEIESSIIVQ